MAGPTIMSDTPPSLGDWVRNRFGVLPNFFQLGPETPEITGQLWGFAQAAYLDNPLPSVFKERLFVHLSRFCAVRYCIARHTGFLVGLGRPSGDAHVRPQTVDDVVRLLRRPFPNSEELIRCLEQCESITKPLDALPVSDSEMERSIFAFATHVFLQTGEADVSLKALAKLVGAVRLQYLLMFLAFIKIAHYWTRVHPELTLEADVKRLLERNEPLADCIFNDPEARFDCLTRTIFEELPLLRQQTDRASSLLAAIVESSEDAIISKTLDGIVTSWNRGAEHLFGYTAAEAIGQHITLVVPFDRWSEEAIILERLRRGERVEHFETVRKRKDGSMIDISLTISPVRNALGEIVGASKVARDITAQKQVSRQLLESQKQFRELARSLETQVQRRTQELEQQGEQLRELTGRLLRSHDEERRRLARELHDSAGQIMAALVMNLGQISRFAGGDPSLKKVSEQTEQLAQQLAKEIRTMSYLLHPPLLEECGLASAIEYYVQGLMERSNLKIELCISKDVERLPIESAMTLFRIMQEGLTNVHRHSGSETATIRLSQTASRIFMEVQDAGKGIENEKLARIKAGRTGVGITGMRERVRRLGGTLDIQSGSGGTTVSVTLPTNLSRERQTAVSSGPN
jgi:PAS domain S-box-containing protein